MFLKGVLWTKEYTHICQTCVLVAMENTRGDAERAVNILYIYIYIYIYIYMYRFCFEAFMLHKGSAGLGVGMLSGAGDPLVFFSDFDDLSRVHHRKNPFVLESPGRNLLFLDPRKSTNIQIYSIFFKSMFDLLGFAYVFGFQIYKTKMSPL